MCLAIPGKIIEIEDLDDMTKIGLVDFHGVIKKVNLSYVPEARVLDYVIVHVGFAISKIDEAAAQRTFEYLEEMERF